MGRVSDAFRRTTVNNKSPVSQMNDEPALLVSGLTAGHSHGNGQDHSSNGKVRLIAKAVEEHSGRQDQPIADGLPQPASENEQESHGHLRENVSQPKKGWRQRLENLLLGRARNHLRVHPLPALHQSSPAGEQYKILREQIRKITGKRTSYILAVTSPIKGDGKSTVAANLAAAMVLNHEERVLLIDGDLRSPRLHDIFGIKSVPGLVEYLSANLSADLLSYIQSTSLSGLRILPAGKPSTHSSELVGNEKMKTLVKEIPTRFPGHLVIVDTPPILSTSDSLVLAQQVDGIVMVIRWGRTPRASLTDALKVLGSNKVIGVILNGAEIGTESQYYYTSAS
jgi:protein-tyrosine kinase